MILSRIRYRSLLKVLIFFIFFTIFFILLFKVSYIVGSSMEPNLFEGDLCLMIKPCIIKKYKRGDIVMLYMPATKKMIIKRVVGLPNEYVEVNRGYLFVNGAIIEEPYKTIKSGVFEAAGKGDKRTLGKDELFLLGDNRDTSFDSRYFGPVKINEIRGKLLFSIRTRR